MGDPIAVTLGADEDYLDADFGFAPGGTIGDLIYRDDNGDGDQSPSEPGINDITVNLYLEGDEDVTVPDTYLTIAKTSTIIADAITIGSVDPGEVVEYAVTITNGGTATASNVAVTDAVPTGTTYNAGFGVSVIAPEDVTDTFVDDFDDGIGGTDFPAGSDGTQAWAGDWTENNAASVSDLGDYSLEVGKNDNPQRTADLSTYDTATRPRRRSATAPRSASTVPSHSATPRSPSRRRSAYQETTRVERDLEYSFAAPGGDPWYDVWIAAIYSPTHIERSLTVEDYQPQAAPAVLDLSLWGVTDWPQTPDHHGLPARRWIPSRSAACRTLTPRSTGSTIRTSNACPASRSPAIPAT